MPEQTPRSKALETIRKLLAKAQDSAATQAEAQAFLAKVRELMDRFSVTEQDLPNEPWATVEIIRAPGIRFPAEWAPICPVLSEFFLVRFVNRRFLVDDIPMVSIEAFGTQVNCEVGSWVFRYLATTYVGLFERYRIATRCHKNKRSAYYFGLSCGLAKSLREAAESQKVGASYSTYSEARVIANEIVLADQRETLNREFEAQFPGPEVRVPRGRDRDAQIAGVRDGREIKIARPLESKSILSIEHEKS